MPPVFRTLLLTVAVCLSIATPGSSDLGRGDLRAQPDDIPPPSGGHVEFTTDLLDDDVVADDGSSDG